MLSYVYIDIVYFLCCYNYKSTLFNSDLILNQYYVSYDILMILYQHLNNVESSIY